MTREVSGLGYSDYSRWGNIDWCAGTPGGFESRMLCFVDNDILDQTTAERAGCVRAHRHAWFNIGAPREITCETENGNAGHVWCCPSGAVRDMPMTQAERERATTLLLAEQQAREENRLPEIAKTVEPTERVEPGPQQQFQSFITKLRAKPEIIVAVMALGAGAFMAYSYYYRSRRPVSRLATSEAR